MKIKFTLLFLLGFLSASTVSAQKFNLNGRIVDPQGEPMPGVSVFLLDAADSTFVQYGSSNSVGNYSIKAVSIGSYLIQTPFVGFQTLYTPIQVKGDSKDISVPTITMKEDSQLDEVTVETDAIPMRMKGDTLEYNAAAFKTRANDVAEDLIKQLPGVDVDKDGNIKTQGEDVNRVLVNGKEFFGDDKKVATKNLPADAIEKVQVFDRKSDQAELSGIDDGNTEKTINIELKEDQSKGYFGRLNGGWGYNDDEQGDLNYDPTLAGGTYDRFDFDASVNYFTKKTQLAFLGQANNTNKQGFSFQDYVSFIGGYDNLDGNRWNFNSSGSSVPLSGSGTSGLSESLASGLNFNHDFSKNTKLMSSYFYSLYKNDLKQSSFTENFIESGSFISENEGVRETEFGSHRVSLRFDHKFDSTNQLRIRGSLKKNDGTVESMSSAFTNNVNDTLQNDSFSNFDSRSDDFSFNANVLHSKRLKKKGRVLTTNITGSNSTSYSPLNLESGQTYYFYSPLAFQFDTVINQFQEDNNSNLNYSVRVTFTEPIGKKRYVELSASHQNNNISSIRDYFDIIGDNRRLNNVLSTNYSNEYSYNSGGLSFRQNRKKYNFTVGANLQQTLLNGQIISMDTSIRKEFLDILPRINLNYKITNTKRILLRYNTNINAPSVTQLQPAPNNTDPLNVYFGNSDLGREYNHTLYAHYLTFSQFNNTNFYTNIYAQFTDDKIVNATRIDEVTLIRETQPINVDYDFFISNTTTFGAPLKFLKSKFNSTLNNSFNKGIVYVNSNENISERISNGVEFSVENTKKDIFDILVGVEFSRTNTQYSVNTEFNQTFFTTTYFADLTLDLNRWSINTTFDYNNYSGDAFDKDQIIPIFNAFISRQMLESKRMELRISAYDILNRNIGFDRTFNLNYLQEQRTNNLSRYFMLSAFYRLGKNDKGGDGMKWGNRRKKW